MKSKILKDVFNDLKTTCLDALNDKDYEDKEGAISQILDDYISLNSGQINEEINKEIEELAEELAREKAVCQIIEIKDSLECIYQKIIDAKHYSNDIILPTCINQISEDVKELLDTI